MGKMGNMHISKLTNLSSSLPNPSGGETKRRKALGCKTFTQTILDFPFPVKLLQEMYRIFWWVLKTKQRFILLFGIKEKSLILQIER